jgi:uncharacterized protein
MSSLLPQNGKIQLAVVTGGHSFQVPPFYELFRHLSDVDFYPQSLDEFTADPNLAAAYDVVLFYTMHQFSREAVLPWYQANTFSTLEQLGHARQGICVLHHALVAFPEWPLWSEVVGIDNRRDIETDFDQDIAVEVADASHPIMQGIESPGWILRDETYAMASPRAEDGNHLLLTTSHPRSMNALAWTRTFRENRVFCFQSGHDQQCFENPHFRRILTNALHWLRPETAVKAST